jgi:hypothetical protein
MIMTNGGARADRAMHIGYYAKVLRFGQMAEVPVYCRHPLSPL